MTINCRGTLIDLSSPRVMGILNITPDSFYDGGAYHSMNDVLAQAEKMLQEGATFLDVGGHSSRPNAAHVSTEEELGRVLPAVKSIAAHFPEAILSIDTFRSEIAKACVEEGAAMVNDISGGELDAEMFSTVAELKVPYIAMHMQGNPQTMQSNPTYEDVVFEVRRSLSEKIASARDHKINDVVVDVGFGFGKTVAHNYELLKNLDLFAALEVPILVGVSRKSMIYKVLETTPAQALNGTTALNTIALLKGANILRVHDVKEAIECAKLFQQMN